MLNITFVHTLLFIAIVVNSNSTLAINRCTLNSKITYTDSACPDSADGTLFDSPGISPDNSTAAKKRHLANQQELKKINRQRVKDENHQQEEARAIERQERRSKAYQLKCDELKFKQEMAKWEEANASTNTSTHTRTAKSPLQKNSRVKEKAQIKSRRAFNTYWNYCEKL